MSNEIVLILFYFFILIYSVILHEIAHGVVALWLGDLTAKYAGRLTLNPMGHIDPFGSVIIPVVLFLTTGFAFGYAKPVPYNPYNLRDQKWGPLWVALAGPGSNFLLAAAAALFAKLLPITMLAKEDILRMFLGVIGSGGNFLEHFHALALSVAGSLPNIFFGLFLFVIFWNIVLGCFNLLPVPPLDGSRLLFILFPVSNRTQALLEQYGFMLLLIIIFVFPGILSAFVSFFLNLFLRFTL